MARGSHVLRQRLAVLSPLFRPRWSRRTIPGMAHEKATALWGQVTPEFLSLPDVAMGRMFGTIGLGVRGKIFAFLGTEGDLVVKVGEERAGALLKEGIAELKVMRGRPMREWVALQIEDSDEWPRIIADGHTFVDSITPR